jgi:hypothetical protein
MQDKKLFCANGQVDRKRQFFVDPTVHVRSQYLYGMLHGTFRIVVAPSQSGKSTRKTILSELLRQNNIIPIEVDMTAVVATRSNQNIHLIKAFIHEVTPAMRLIDPDFDAESVVVSTMFHISKKWCQKRTFALLMDDFSAISCCDRDERNIFLSALRSIKQGRVTKDNAVCGMIAFTNCIGDLVTNVTETTEEIIYWTPDEVFDLFGQYAAQENIDMKILDGIVKYIYECTEGAQGLTNMFGSMLTKWVSKHNEIPSLKEWKKYTNGSEFFEEIAAHSNYQHMKSFLTRDCLEYLTSAFYVESDDIDDESKTTLLEANVMMITECVKLRHVNPFVSRLVQSFYKQQDYTYRPEFDENGKLDFVHLVTCVMQNTTILDIMYKERKTSYNGPKCYIYLVESAYASAFDSVLNRIFYSVTGYQEEAGKVKLSSTTHTRKDEIYDSFYDLYNHKIAVEHCSNIDMLNGNAFAHHFKQTVSYAMNLETKPEQTWLIVWTTKKPGQHSPETDHHIIEMFYPSDPVNNVETMYIYHDDKFTEVCICLKDKRIEIKPREPILKEDDVVENPFKRYKSDSNDQVQPVRVRVVPPKEMQERPMFVLIDAMRWEINQLKQEIEEAFEVKVDEVLHTSGEAVESRNDISMLQKTDELTFTVAA